MAFDTQLAFRFLYIDLTYTFFSIDAQTLPRLVRLWFWDVWDSTLHLSTIKKTFNGKNHTIYSPGRQYFNQVNKTAIMIPYINYSEVQWSSTPGITRYSNDTNKPSPILPFPAISYTEKSPNPKVPSNKDRLYISLHARGGGSRSTMPGKEDT